MKNNNSIHQIDWLYPLKKKIILGILGILTLTLILTMVFTAFFLRSSLIDDSEMKTIELSNAVKSSLSSLMIKRDPDMIQDTIKNLGKTNGSIIKVFIIDKSGRIAYSSMTGEIGTVLDRFKDEMCRGCHQGKDRIPSETTIITDSNGNTVHRNVKVIYNEEACFGCHSNTDKINGKLIIDRSLKQTYAFIALIDLAMLGTGIVCLVLLIPFLSRVLSKGLDKYISKIVNQNTELSLLYLMIERLSKTIDLEELKPIVFEIIRETLDADEIDLVLRKTGREYNVTSWSRAENKIFRKKMTDDNPLSPVIADWLDGKLTKDQITGDEKKLYMPISKGNNSLALISVTKTGSKFDPMKLGFIGAISSHIAVSFENAMLYYIAITDELTQLYTQRHFRNIIDKKFFDFEKYGEKITLLMLDIDNFKKINDTYGHVTGDSVLKDIASTITASTRDNDLSFRYGGEEFIVVLPSTDMEGGRHVAERMRINIENFIFEKGTLNLKITVSTGVAVCPDNARTVRDLILSADQALYKAKQTGKNKVVISEVKPNL